jgi:hypothetical protein
VTLRSLISFFRLERRSEIWLASIMPTIICLMPMNRTALLDKRHSRDSWLAQRSTLPASPPSRLLARNNIRSVRDPPTGSARPANLAVADVSPHGIAWEACIFR